MALKIIEFFGYDPTDASPDATRARRQKDCPFLGAPCTKTLRDGSISGACTVQQMSSGPIICCPNRLYDNDYRILRDVAQAASWGDVTLMSAQKLTRPARDGRKVVVFGKRWGKELRLPQRGGHGGYFVDWILALIGSNGQLQDFVAVEVQAIDTTGNYRAQRDAYLKGRHFAGSSPAGLNWENVAKRILPQIIYKGHVLRREPLCTKGMFFVCPTPVYGHIQQRLGNQLLKYGLQPGTLTFQWYDIGAPVAQGAKRGLQLGGQFTTTVDQVALAFTSPANLPPARVYEEAIKRELDK